MLRCEEIETMEKMDFGSKTVEHGKKRNGDKRTNRKQRGLLELGTRLKISFFFLREKKNW